MSEKRQKNQIELAFTYGRKGEARKDAEEGTEALMAKGVTENPTGSERLMEAVCETENLKRALRRVKANKGSAGVDGMRVDQLPRYLIGHWNEIREQLLSGTYKAQPVRRVEIDKPDGGKRELGIPTAIDRFVQQAVLQVLQQQWDPTFSIHSHGFRPEHSQHGAIAEAQQYQAEGYGWVVDIDLEKFFDRVNHDRLMSRLAERVSDKRMLKLIGGFLRAGVLEGGVVSPSEEGTPQGGPLSPLLSNIVLDELDKELERRGLRFVRYADDCNIYVRSERAGKRVMETITRFISGKLKLRVNESKSAVARPHQRKFLGFSFTREEKPRRTIAPKSIQRAMTRLRELTRRKRGGKLKLIVDEITRYLKGWLGYYGFSETCTPQRDLDQWLRRRLRSLVWTRWKTPNRRYRELRKQGVSHALASTTASSGKGPWPLSASKALSFALPNDFFDSLGLQRLYASRV
jgi:RNA-directed DNA polymerase